MKRLLVVLAVLLLCGTAWGQIKVPAEVEPYKFVDCELEAVIPDGAYLADGGWDVIGETVDQVADVRPVGNKCTFVGTPGKYSIIYDGVILMDIKFTDGSGKEITVRNYLGKAKGRAVCTIKGAVPPDPPLPPPPPPDQKWQIVMIHRSEKLSTLPQGQKDLLTSLKVRKNLVAEGHIVLEVLDNNVLAGGSPAKLRPYVDAVIKSQKELPVIAISPRDRSAVPLVFPLPADEAALMSLLGGAQ